MKYKTSGSFKKALLLLLGSLLWGSSGALLLPEPAFGYYYNLGMFWRKAAVSLSLPSLTAGSPFFWVKADSLSTNHANLAGVPVWPDQSPQANDAKTATTGGATAPIFHASGAAINNQPYVTFDHTAISCLISQSNVGILNDVTFFVVFRSDASNGYYEAIFGQDWWNGIKMTRENSASNVWTTYVVGSDGQQTTRPDGTWYLFATGRSGAANTSWWNGTAAGTTTTTATATDDNKVAIGCMPDFAPWGPQNFGGDIAEIVAFSSYLSASDRSAVECYLSTKYGLTLGHSCP